MHLETRFAQLSTAIEMELWQEAYRTVEDVHSLIVQMKRPPKAATMAGYHAQLAQVERGRTRTLTLLLGGVTLTRTLTLTLTLTRTLTRTLTPTPTRRTRSAPRAWPSWQRASTAR